MSEIVFKFSVLNILLAKNEKKQKSSILVTITQQSINNSYNKQGNLNNISLNTNRTRISNYVNVLPQYYQCYQIYISKYVKKMLSPRDFKGTLMQI